MATHESIADPYRHEPKGASTATATHVYVADGSGSGSWRKVKVTELDRTGGTTNAFLQDNGTSVAFTTINNANKVYLSASMADICTPGSVYIVTPFAGTITKFYSVIQAAVTTADTNIKLQIGGVDVSNGALVVAFTGSAAGTVDSATPTAANTVTAGQAIEIETDGGGDSVTPANFLIEITVA